MKARLKINPEQMGEIIDTYMTVSGEKHIVIKVNDYITIDATVAEFEIVL